ncbi:MAG: ATP-grasp domain-containing protein [Pseudomonadales bacterium]
MKKMCVGIIGAGQLGAYLCEAACTLNLETVVLAQNQDDPAVALADRCIFGDLDDALAVHELCRIADVITFEREDIGESALLELERGMQLEACAVAPRPYLLKLLQNKADQKQWLVKKGFPTAPFLDGDLLTMDQIIDQFEFPFVQKAKRGGFDGRGVQVLDASNLSEYWSQGAFVEKHVPYVQEISALIARDSTGNLAYYPLVEAVTKPGNHVLDYALSPARISTEQKSIALRLAADIVTEFQGVGLFAIEMFLQADGTVLINEISPRVHNTGHLTLEANDTSQFEQHLRAICGLGLGSTKQSGAALCKNVLNVEDNSQFGNRPFSRQRFDQGTWFHWYGKLQVGAQRKLGHITCTANTADEAADKLTECRTLEQALKAEAA